MNDQVFSVVLALARSGIAHELPSVAYLHQVKRLANVLSDKQQTAIQEILDWHNNGRKPGMVAIAKSSLPLPQQGGEQADGLPCPFCGDAPGTMHHGPGVISYRCCPCHIDYRSAAMWNHHAVVLPQVGEAKEVAPEGLIERLRIHVANKDNTAFARSTMREVLEILTSPVAQALPVAAEINQKFKLVPMEATESMVFAAQDIVPPRMFSAVYRAMVNAAPLVAEKDDIEGLIQNQRIAVEMAYEGPITVRVYDDAEIPVAEGEGDTLRAAIVDALGGDYA